MFAGELRKHGEQAARRAGSVDRGREHHKGVLRGDRPHEGGHRRPVHFDQLGGFRALLVNRRVGSSDGSQHRLGEAGDIEVPGVPNFTLAEWIATNLPYDQLILEAYTPGEPGSGWVHVSYRPGRSHRSILTMTLGSHGPVYSKGLHA